jgi:predicted HicB family RNase H-like nuclease
MSNAIHIRLVPDDLKQQAKIAAAKQGITLRQWVIAAVRAALERK